MAVEAPAWMVYLIDFLIFILFVIGVVFILAFYTYRNAQGKMIAEIWEPSGYPVRRLAKWEKSGKTVEVDGLTYVLKQETSEEEKQEILKGHGQESEEIQPSIYPSHRYTGYGIWPFRAILRIETWIKGNPNPLRPPAEKPEVSAAELTSIKNEIYAISLGMEIQEAQERQKQLTGVIANMPSKTVLYIICGGTLFLTLITLVIVFQLSGI